jgi:hypothetical protein
MKHVLIICYSLTYDKTKTPYIFGMEYLIILGTIIENILDIYAHFFPITGKLGLRVEDMEIKFTHIRLHRVHCSTGTLETYLAFPPILSLS